MDRPLVFHPRDRCRSPGEALNTTFRTMLRRAILPDRQSKSSFGFPFRVYDSFGFDQLILSRSALASAISIRFPHHPLFKSVLPGARTSHDFVTERGAKESHYNTKQNLHFQYTTGGGQTLSRVAMLKRK